MDWVEKLQRKFGRHAIKNLMFYIIGFNALVFIWGSVEDVGQVVGILMLEPSLILEGQVWRLVTFIFIPPTFSFFWVLFALYFYYIVGSGLEQEWGAFKFNLYYLIGMTSAALVAFATGRGDTGIYLNTSLFLAFATLFPDFKVLLFLIMPIKIKYMAYLSWGFILFTIVFSPLYLKAAAVGGTVPYFLFFGKKLAQNIRMKWMVYKHQRRFTSEVKKPGKDY